MTELGKGPKAWLRNSLRARAKDLRTRQRDCIRAYKTEPMASAAGRLAVVYGEAAMCFEAELRKLEES